MIQQLEYLIALAEQRHFGRAATACHVTQPALSAGIRTLERDLDVVIVHRSRRFEGFTPEGARIVTWAHRILAERREMLTDVQRMRGRLTATARIGAIPTSEAVVPLLSDRFRADHPAATVQVLSLPSRQIARLLTDFELDAAITYLDSETPPGTRRFELYRERYFLIGPADSPVLDAARVSWADAARLPLCALTLEMRNRRMIEAAMAAEGVSFRPVIEANNVAALYVHLGAGGLGTVVAHPWIHGLGVPAGMRARPITLSGPGPQVGLITLDTTRSSLVSDALLAAARRADVARRLDDAVPPDSPGPGS